MEMIKFEISLNLVKIVDQYFDNTNVFIDRQTDMTNSNQNMFIDRSV